MTLPLLSMCPVKILNKDGGVLTSARWDLTGGRLS